MNIKTIPKAELHCHLDGIVDRQMAWDIHRADPSFALDPREFERAYPIGNDMESFFQWWRFIEPIEGDLLNFYPILGRYIQRLKADGVRYSEVMVSAGETSRDPGRAVQELRALREWVKRQEAGEIQVEFLIAIGRNKPPKVVDEIGDRVLKMHEAGLIVGVALAGPEKGYPVRPFAKTFARFHKAGLGIEIHAGEWCGPESVWDALAHGYPDRIGHGVSLFQDPRLIDIVRERRLHIEMCPTSNLKTGSVASIEEHPIAQARELGLNFSVNTDDPGPFECRMASEYELLVDVFGFDEQDFEQIYTNSLAARFQPQLRIGGV